MMRYLSGAPFICSERALWQSGLLLFDVETGEPRNFSSEAGCFGASGEPSFLRAYGSNQEKCYYADLQSNPERFRFLDLARRSLSETVSFPVGCIPFTPSWYQSRSNRPAHGALHRHENGREIVGESPYLAGPWHVEVVSVSPDSSRVLLTRREPGRDGKLWVEGHDLETRSLLWSMPCPGSVARPLSNDRFIVNDQESDHAVVYDALTGAVLHRFGGLVDHHISTESAVIAYRMRTGRIERFEWVTGHTTTIDAAPFKNGARHSSMTMSGEEALLYLPEKGQLVVFDLLGDREPFSLSIPASALMRTDGLAGTRALHVPYVHRMGRRFVANVRHLNPEGTASWKSIAVLDEQELRDGTADFISWTDTFDASLLKRVQRVSDTGGRVCYRIDMAESETFGRAYREVEALTDYLSGLLGSALGMFVNDHTDLDWSGRLSFDLSGHALSDEEKNELSLLTTYLEDRQRFRRAAGADSSEPIRIEFDC